MISSSALRTLRTRVTVFCGSSPVPPSPSSPERRRRRRRREVPSLAASSEVAGGCGDSASAPSALGGAVTVAVGGLRAVAGLAAAAAATAAPAAAAAGLVPGLVGGLVGRARRWARWRRSAGVGSASTLGGLVLVGLGRGCRLGGELGLGRAASAGGTVGCGTWKSGTAAGASSAVSATGSGDCSGALLGGRTAAAFLRVRLALAGSWRPRLGVSAGRLLGGRGGLLGRGLLRGGLLGRRLLRRGLLGRGRLLGLSAPGQRSRRCQLRRPRRREWASRRAWSAPRPGAAYRPGPCPAPATRRLRAATQSLRSAATPSAVCVTGGLASPAAVAGPDFRSAPVTRTPRPRRGLATIGPRVCQPRSGCGRDGRERRRVEPAGSRSGRRQYRTARSGCDHSGVIRAGRRPRRSPGRGVPGAAG